MLLKVTLRKNQQLKMNIIRLKKKISPFLLSKGLILSPGSVVNRLCDSINGWSLEIALKVPWSIIKELTHYHYLILVLKFSLDCVITFMCTCISYWKKYNFPHLLKMNTCNIKMHPVFTTCKFFKKSGGCTGSPSYTK